MSNVNKAGFKDANKKKFSLAKNLSIENLNIGRSSKIHGKSELALRVRTRRTPACRSSTAHSKQLVRIYNVTQMRTAATFCY